MSYWWIILVIILIIYLVWSEQGSQDCLYKKCHNWTEPVSDTDSITSGIDKTILTVRKNHHTVGWRRALFMSIIITVPICLILIRSFPNGYTFTVVAGIIFVGSYLIYAWIEYTQIAPRDTYIENKLLKIRNM